MIRPPAPVINASAVLPAGCSPTVPEKEFPSWGAALAALQSRDEAPQAWRASLERIRAVGPERVHFCHHTDIIHA